MCNADGAIRLSRPGCPRRRDSSQLDARQEGPHAPWRALWFFEAALCYDRRTVTYVWR